MEPGEQITLRAAITQANQTSGHQTIVLPEGVYALSVPGADEDAAATGDLDITDDLVPEGTEDFSELADVLVSEGLRLLEFQEDQPNLESAFMALTKGMSST